LYPNYSGVLVHLSTGLVLLFYDVLRYCTLERQLSTISTVPGRFSSNPCILNHGILHKAYHDDYAAACPTPPLNLPQRAGSYDSIIDWGDGPTKDDMMLWTPKDFSQYCCPKAYHDDYAAACPTPPLNLPQRAGSYDSFRETRNGNGASSMTHSVTIHEIHRGIKKEGTCYQYTKDYKELNEWNEHVVEATQIDCTHSAFNVSNIPKDDS
jgi:hypothetical protein